MSLAIGNIEAIKQRSARPFGALAGVHFPASHDEGQRGFTLVELIMILIIVGVLAVTAIPRLMDPNIFRSRGFADQVQASLRYAQKEAIAQHHYICVAFTGSSVTLTLDPVSPDPTAHPAATCPGSANLANPAGGASYSISNTSGATLSGYSNFYYDALGKPSAAPQTITVNGAPNNIVVEAQTGYVHSP